MTITNLSNPSKKQYQLLSNGKSYVELQFSSDATFCTSSISTWYNEPDGGGEVAGVWEINPNSGEGDNEYDDGRAVYPGAVDDDANRFYSFQNTTETNPSSNFDVRFIVGYTSLRNDVYDQNARIVFGILGPNFDATSNGRLYGVLDTPTANRRRFRIVFGRSNNPDVVLFSQTEASLAEFGTVTASDTYYINGYVVKGVRFYRYGNNIKCEWNYWSENYHSYINKFCKSYKHSITFNANAGYSNNSSWNIFGAAQTLKCQFGGGTLIPPGGNITTQTIEIQRVDFLPALCFDTTCAHIGADPIWTRDNKLGCLVDGKGESISDVSVRITDNRAYTQEYKTNSFSFIRKEEPKGRTAGFLYDNKLIYANTFDVKRDIVTDEVYRLRSRGNLLPTITTDTQYATDHTFYIEINKTGNTELRGANDTTDLNLRGVTALSQINEKTIFGDYNLPTYTVSDGTFTLGRDNYFRLLHNVKLTDYEVGETPIAEEVRTYERDTTSIYIIETVTKAADQAGLGNEYIVYSRYFNMYDHSLSARVRINTDATVFLETKAKVFGDGECPVIVYRSPVTDYNRITPKPNLLHFKDKDIVFLNALYFLSHSVTADNSKRLGYVSYDKGLTWILERDKNLLQSPDTYDYIIDTSYGTDGDVYTFKLRNNDDIFINTKSYLQEVYVYSHNKSDFNTTSSLDVKIRPYSSKIYGTGDATCRYIHCAFDPIREEIAIINSGLNTNYIEIFKSEKVRQNSFKSFETGVLPEIIPTISAQSRFKWRSEYIVNPYFISVPDPASSMYQGRPFIAYDRNGDLLMVNSMRFDSTVFFISRTNTSKDELNVMGRFLECNDKLENRVDRFINEMWTDSQGDIILSTCAPSSSTTLFLGIMKYGQLSNVPLQLNMDRGIFYPQNGQMSNVTSDYDSTTNGWLYTPSSTSNPCTKLNGDGYSLATTYDALSPGRGFKSEWQMFSESLFATTDNAGSRIEFQLFGAIVSPTERKAHFPVIGWSRTTIWAYDYVTGSPSLYLGVANFTEANRLHRYLFTATGTSDNSAHCKLYYDDLNLSSSDKIIWKKALEWTRAMADTVPGGTYDSINFWHGVSGALTSTIHMTYWFVSKIQSPIQPQRGRSSSIASENIPDTSDFYQMPGIPINTKYINKHDYGLNISWFGLDGFIADRCSFQIRSNTDPSSVVNKEPTTTWRSYNDNTTSVIFIDATNNGDYDFISANVAVFKNANFRRCFIEGANVNLANASTSALYSKEVFFDIDSGVLAMDATNYGTTTVVNQPNKNWRVGEHRGRLVQFEYSKSDGTPFRHMSYRILNNSKTGLTIQTSKRFDSTTGIRYVIYDPSQSVRMGFEQRYKCWRVRIPPNQCANPATIGDETAQGRIWLEPYREIGEFDMGYLTKPNIDIDRDFTIDVETNIKNIEFENNSSVSFEYARSKKIFRVKYTNGTNDSMNKIVQMFNYLYGSGKTLWFFEDQENMPRNFYLCRIVNQPQINKTSNDIYDVQIELEEIT